MSSILLLSATCGPADYIGASIVCLKAFVKEQGFRLDMDHLLLNFTAAFRG